MPRGEGDGRDGEQSEDFPPGEQPERAHRRLQAGHRCGGQDPHGGQGDPSLVARRLRKDGDHVAGEARGEPRGDAGIQNEEALPAVQESGPLAPGFAQIDVEAAALGPPRRELSEGQRTREDEGACAEPEAESQRRRGERPDRLRGRQEDADADRVSDDERGGGRESEGPLGARRRGGGRSAGGFGGRRAPPACFAQRRRRL